MLLYTNNDSLAPAREHVRVVSYNIDHGDDFNNEANEELRKTLVDMLSNGGEELQFIFLQECTEDVLQFLCELLHDHETFSLVHSKKIINDRSRKYNNFEYFVAIYRSDSSRIELRHSDLVELSPIKLLDDTEKRFLMDTRASKNRPISLYRKLLDSNKLMVHHVQFRLKNKNKDADISFFNVHLSSKPHLNFIQAYMLKKYLSRYHDNNNNENNCILGDFNNKFNSFSLHTIKQDSSNLSALSLKMKNKSSKVRNMNRLSGPDNHYANVTDKLLESTEIKVETVNKIIDHIFFQERHMTLLSYRNDMDVEYTTKGPSDHFYVDCLFSFKADGEF